MGASSAAIMKKNYTYHFTISLISGLHTRPASKLLQLLSTHPNSMISYLDDCVQADSLLEILLIQIPNGSTIKIITDYALPIQLQKNINELLNENSNS